MEEDDKKLEEIRVHLGEIHRRSMGYAFGGPRREWCEGGSDSGMVLPSNPNDGSSEVKTFRGCKKYQSCPLVSQSVRWIPWEELSTSDQESLRAVHCYRASRKGWDWDRVAIQSRSVAGNRGRWIGNPFGIRTQQLGAISVNLKKSGSDIREHRDLSPCPLGGCITPEMERDYRWEQRDVEHGIDEGEGLHNSIACPFFFRHASDNMVEALPNSLRFAQCYATLPEFLALMEEGGIVVATPVIRSSERAGEPGEMYWYPFYSAYSAIQIPTRLPNREREDGSLSLGARWQITRLTRESKVRSSRKLPLAHIFEGAEEGSQTTEWERTAGLISISEGQATAFLLQWILVKRISAEAGQSSSLMLRGLLEYVYSDKVRGDLFKSLAALEEAGYDLIDLFGLHRSERGYARQANLEQDLSLLGLIDGLGHPTLRVACCLRWLKARINNFSSERSHIGGAPSLNSTVLAWLGPAEPLVRDLSMDDNMDRDVLPRLIQCLLVSALDKYISFPEGSATWESLDRISLKEGISREELVEYCERWINDDSAPRGFRYVCRLVPEMHVLVRANWITPLRWIFMPMSVDLRTREMPASRIYSGVIIMIEDELDSLPYAGAGSLTASEDKTLKRLDLVLPAIFQIASLEESLVRSDLIVQYRYWEERRPVFAQIYHLLREVITDLGTDKSAESNFARSVLQVLARRFIIPQTPPPAGLNPRKPQVIDLCSALEEAVAVYNSYYGVRKCFAELTMQVEKALARVQPLEEAYADEDMKNKASAAMVLLFLDGLVQRASHQSVPIQVKLYKVAGPLKQIAIEIESIFSIGLQWSSDDQRELPKGRGFHSFFATARFLGAIRQEVADLPASQHGVVRLFFEEAQ